MNWALSLYILVLSTAGILTAVLAVIGWRQRKSTRFPWFALLLFAISEWTICAMLEAASPHPEVKVFWSTLEYAGLAFTPTLYLIFILEFSHLEQLLTRRFLGFMAIFPIVTVVFAGTNSFHHWLWSSFTTNTQQGIMTYSYGPFFWVNAVYSYILIFAATILLVWDAFRFHKIYRGQVWALLASAVVPWVLNIVYIFNWVPQLHLDWTSAGFALTGIIFSVTIYRFQLADLIPMARGQVLDNLTDSVFVLDDSNRIIDFNPAAMQFLGVKGKGLVGQQASDVLSCCPEMVKAITETSKLRSEIEVESEPSRFIELDISPLYDRYQNVISKIVLFRDITDRKRNDLRLLDALDFNRRIISTSPVGIIVYRESGECILVNEAACEIVNATQDDLLAQNFHQIQSWKKSGLYNLAKTALSSGVVQRSEIHHYSTFKREIWMDVSMMPFSSGGEPHLLFLMNDVTHQKHIQDAEHSQRVLAEALRDTAQALNSSLDLDVILDRVLANIGRVMPYDSAEIFLFDDQGNVQLGRVKHAEVEEDANSVVSDELMEKSATDFATLRRVRSAKQPIIIPDVNLDPTWVAIPGFEWIRSHINVPLGVKGKVIGAIGLNSQKVGFFSEINAGQILAFANSAAIAIENARLYAEVQRLAITDELTGLYNYRAMMDMGPREVERARRFNHNLSALFMDIDNFSDFNNRYSHAVGNQVLQAVAQCLMQALRMMDFVVRFGGEEFVALLPETPVKSAYITAERLREKICRRQVPTEWGDLSVTVSIGVAELTPATPDLDALIDLANMAEHKAKESGRNRVVMFG